MTMTKGAVKFIEELAAYKGWDLRYTPDGTPYVALVHGFGNGEPGVRLQFVGRGGAIRVVGFIEHSQHIKVRRPYVFVSIYKGVETAYTTIHNTLLPRYKEMWYQAQPLIDEWRKEHPDP